MTNPTERQIEDLICDYLSYIPNSHYIKNAPSGFFDGKKMVKHRSKFIKNGLSDIFFWKNGEFIAFEVKAPIEMKFLLKHKEEIIKTDKKFLSKKKQHLKDQLQFIQFMEICGHQGYFVSSLDDVKQILRTGKKKGDGFCETMDLF